MKHGRIHLVASEENSSYPILIIDKNGIVGSSLADKLKEQFLVVLVSGKELDIHKNIIHIPYRKKIPVIPDNSYSHIFTFYNGEEETLEMLSVLVKKAQDTNGKVLFLTPLTHNSPALFRRLDDHIYHSMGIIVYGEVFDEEARSANMVNYFIYQARKNAKLEIPNEGMGKLYPVYLADLLMVIIAAAFSEERKNGKIFVFPKHPFSEISVARIFQKINPELKIDFNKRKTRSSDYFIPDNGEYAFDSYDIEGGLRKLDLSESPKRYSTSEKQLSAPIQRRPYSHRLILLLLVLILLFPLLLVLITGAVGAGLLSLSLRDAEGGKFQNASQYAHFAEELFQVGETVGNNYYPADFLAPVAVQKLDENFRTGKQLAQVEVDLFSSLYVFSNIYNGTSSNPKNDFSKSLATVKNTLLKLDEMKAQNQLPQNLQARLSDNSYMIYLLENTIDTSPQILGFQGEKKYLILFQNNMELRPGGGFIGSYGILDINNGKFGKLDIHDVYDADGKLTTHIEPPFGLRRYEGASHFFLRDSNFAVDNTVNAAASADILSRETGEKVDGVITVDTNFIKNILSVLGTVTVNDYKEQVTADNFYLLTQKHAEENFFPGSTQKSDFLRSLLSSMQESLSEKKGVSYLKLSRAIEQSIKEKHLQFVFVDSAIQKIFTVNNLSGAVWDGRQINDNTFDDFLGTVDANLGQNKTNYYLHRSISQNVTISDSGQIDEEATINYQNMSKKNSVFGGDYKNYVRFILPTGADLKFVSIDNKQVAITSAITDPSLFSAANFHPPSALEIETTEVNGKEVVGFFLIVAIESSKKVSINYTVPQIISATAPSFSYDLLLRKQPGTDQDPYSLTLSYPNKFKPIDLGRDTVDLGGKLTYETALPEDRDINIKFSQK